MTPADWAVVAIFAAAALALAVAAPNAHAHAVCDGHATHTPTNAGRNHHA